MPHNPTTEKNYRGGNAVYLMATQVKKGYEDSRWLTYRQAGENGWHVRRGETGTRIEFWKFPDSGLSGVPDTPTNPDEDRNAAPKRKEVPLQRIYTVFNGGQIEGISPYQPKKRQEWEVVQAGESILKNSGAIIRYDQSGRAYYSKSADEIHLPRKEAFPSARSFYGTALHELAHWSGHSSRLNRETLVKSDGHGSELYAKEELRAEIASLFLSAERSIPHNPEQHAAYVDSWLKALRGDKNEIFHASRDAANAVDYLIGLENQKDLALPGAAVGRVEAAQTVSGTYLGAVVGETETHVLQQATANTAIAHPKELLDSTPQIGASVQIQYSAAKGFVRPVEERMSNRGMSR